MNQALKILSLGAGVQSSVIALMSAAGELPAIDAAGFADTQWEKRATYEHLQWLCGAGFEPVQNTDRFRAIPGVYKSGVLPFPVYVRTKGDLRADAIEFRRLPQSSDGKRYASMPHFIKNPDGSQGKVRRQCTREYKIDVVEQIIKREILGLAKGQRVPPGSIDHWFGISIDEKQRMRQAKNRWERNVYPLCNWPVRMLPAAMDRADCHHWFEAHFSGRPLPDSACLGCPFRNNAGWVELRTVAPGEFADAISFDKDIRVAEIENQSQRKMLVGVPFTHRQMVPLDDVDFSTLEDLGQGGFIDECAGVCGV